MSTVPAGGRRLRVAIALGVAVTAVSACGGAQREAASHPSAQRQVAPEVLTTAVHHRRHHTTVRHHTHHVVATPKAVHKPSHTSPRPTISPAESEANYICLTRTSGLAKALGGQVNPSDNAQAPVLDSRLQGLASHLSGPVNGALQSALQQAQVALRQWGGVVVIGPEDKLHATRLGKRAIASIARVDDAARIAGLGRCVIPLS